MPILISGVWLLISEQGAIAQLGERVNGIHEVGGSIPPGSTKFLKTLIVIAARKPAAPWRGPLSCDPLDRILAMR